MNRLEPILASTRDAVARRRRETSLEELDRAVRLRIEAGDRRSFLDAVRRPGLSLIAEHKRRSPSAGMIRGDLALEDVVSSYTRAGAAAVSVLTEEENFAGTLGDLAAARSASPLPILRKDFIVDSYQVVESFAAGADAILLIVAALLERDLADLQAQALDLGLPALIEVHDAEELRIAVAVGAGIIGINNRDLTTLEVDTRRTFELLGEVPDGTSVVSESGFRRADELRALAEAGVDAVLMGEALMRSRDIESACREMTAPGPPAAL